MAITNSKDSSYKTRARPQSTSAIISLWPADEVPTVHQQQKDIPSLPLYTPNRRTKAALNMIKQEPKDADRYVTTGALYETKRWYSAALDVYQCALIHVPSTHARYGELQDAFKRIRMQLGSFIHLFPPHVLNIIFGQLGNWNLLYCMSVNQVWCRYIVQYPKLWDLRYSGTDRSDVEFFLNGKRDTIILQRLHDAILLYPILRFIATKNTINIKSLRECL